MKMENKRLKVQTNQTADVIVPTEDRIRFKVDKSKSAFDTFPPLKVQFSKSSDLSSVTDEFDVDDKFFYILERYDGGEKLSLGESGMGCLEQVGKEILFVRAQPMQWSSPDGEVTNVTTPQQALTDDVTEHTTFMLVSIYPQNVRDILIDPHVIPVCQGDAIVSPLHVDADSLVGRLKQGLVSISLTDIFKKITSLSLTQLTLKSSKKPKNTEGSIVYDSTSKCLKFFDGTQWRKISYEDTQES